MTGADYEIAKNHLLSVANIVAPTGKEQRGFVQLVRELETERDVPEYIIQALVSRIYDGLAFGNWPTA